MNTPLPARLLRLFQRAALAAVLLPAAALAQALPAGCNTGEVASVPLTYADGGVPLAEVRINGNPVRALIDTGAQHATLLDKATLEGFGVNVISSESNYAGIDVLNARIDHVAFGPIEFSKAWFAVGDLSADGVGAKLGANFLFRTDLEIALRERYLKFFKPAGCLRAPLAYWDAAAPSVPLQIHPLRKDLRPWFKVRINGDDVRAVLSTTSRHSYLDLYTARRMGLGADTPGALRDAAGITWNDRKEEVWTVPVAQMSIGALPVKDFRLRLVNMERSGEMLVLGTDFLSRHRIYVAMSQNRIYFSPIAPAAHGAAAAP